MKKLIRTSRVCLHGVGWIDMPVPIVSPYDDDVSNTDTMVVGDGKQKLIHCDMRRLQIVW